MKTYQEHQTAFEQGQENIFGETLTEATVTTPKGQVIVMKKDGDCYYMNGANNFYEATEIGRLLEKAESNGATVERVWK